MVRRRLCLVPQSSYTSVTREPRGHPELLPKSTNTRLCTVRLLQAATFTKTKTVTLAPATLQRIFREEEPTYVG